MEWYATDSGRRSGISTFPKHGKFQGKWDSTGDPLRVDVVVPALNEAGAIASVVARVPRPFVRSVVVVDNGSTDGTGDLAREAGAQVVVEPRRGYGQACLAGIAALADDCEVVVFLDADGSDDPSLIPALVAPIASGLADLVIGSRALGEAEKGALTLQQRVGNAIAAAWLRRRFGQPATDLGPFRAVRRECLARLGMSDPTYGWTVQMQLEAARLGLRYLEVPVPYRRRVGESKISGTVKGTLGAAAKILGLLALHELRGLGRPRG